MLAVLVVESDSLGLFLLSRFEETRNACFQKAPTSITDDGVQRLQETKNFVRIQMLYKHINNMHAHTSIYIYIIFLCNRFVIMRLPFNYRSPMMKCIILTTTVFLHIVTHVGSASSATH